MDTVRKTLYYRKAVITKTEKTLEELLREALQKFPTAMDRLEPIDDDSSEVRLINKFQDVHDGFILAQMVLIEQDASQPVVIYEAGAREYQLAGVKPSDVILSEEYKAAKRDFINSMLYFGVINNHVVVIPSAALRFNAIESYLRWLFVSKAKNLHPEAMISLTQEANKNTKKLFESHNVKSIEIGDTVTYVKTSETEEKTEVKNITSQMLKALAEHLGDFKLDSIAQSSNIRAKFVITYSRKTDEDGQKILNGIATNLRNIDDEDVTINLDGAGQLKKGSLNIHTKESIGRSSDGLLIMSDISHVMQNWLASLCDDEGILDDD